MDYDVLRLEQDELEAENKRLREALVVIAENGTMMGGYAASDAATEALMQQSDVPNDGGSNEG